MPLCHCLITNYKNIGNHVYISISILRIYIEDIFYKYTLITKLHKILFDNNIVIFDYNMSNFKIYLILKL